MDGTTARNCLLAKPPATYIAPVIMMLSPNLVGFIGILFVNQGQAQRSSCSLPRQFNLVF